MHQSFNLKIHFITPSTQLLYEMWLHFVMGKRLLIYLSFLWKAIKKMLYIIIGRILKPKKRICQSLMWITVVGEGSTHLQILRPPTPPSFHSNPLRFIKGPPCDCLWDIKIPLYNILHYAIVLSSQDEQHSVGSLLRILQWRTIPLIVIHVVKLFGIA